MTEPAEPGGRPGRHPGGRRAARDRRGRGLRGRLVPPQVPLWRSPADRFDDLVLDALEELEEHWGDQLAQLEFAVEDVPPPDAVEEAGDTVPLSRLLSGGGAGEPPATRIVLYRRPVEARAHDLEDLADLVHDVVVTEVARHLGIDPEIVDPD